MRHFLIQPTPLFRVISSSSIHSVLSFQFCFYACVNSSPLVVVASLLLSTWRTLVVESLSRVRLCDPVDYRTPGSSVLHGLPSLLRLMSIESVCCLTILFPAAPFSSCLQSFPASGSFPASRLFTSDGRSVGASVSVLSMNIQD